MTPISFKNLMPVFAGLTDMAVGAGVAGFLLEHVLGPRGVVQVAKSISCLDVQTVKFGGVTMSYVYMGHLLTASGKKDVQVSFAFRCPKDIPGVRGAEIAHERIIGVLYEQSPWAWTTIQVDEAKYAAEGFTALEARQALAQLLHSLRVVDRVRREAKERLPVCHVEDPVQVQGRKPTRAERHAAWVAANPDHPFVGADKRREGGERKAKAKHSVSQKSRPHPLTRYVPWWNKDIQHAIFSVLNREIRRIEAVKAQVDGHDVDQECEDFGSGDE